MAQTKNQNTSLKKLILAALFLAIGAVLPLFTAQIKEIGDTLLPMHIPVMLCSLICGFKYGLSVGFILPFLRSLVFGMPPVYPNAVWMAFELAAYGFFLGFLYSRFKKQGIGQLYFSLISAQLLGRVVWAAAKAVLMGVAGKSFTFEAFLMGGFVDAFPGIILQLVLIPLIMSLLRLYKDKK
ncbi:MAG: ECF transporter S component [Ruminococcaceae bacterium]|nr:ECF transporter S component [Oscillospiraceae bacterium]